MKGLSTEPKRGHMTIGEREHLSHDRCSFCSQKSERRVLKYKGSPKYCTTEQLPFKKHINKGEQPKYYVRGSREPIIDEETFRKAQRLIESRRPSEREQHEYVFSKMIVCGNCGHSFRRIVSSGKAYWTCHEHNKSITLCPVRQIPEMGICSAFVRLFNRLKSYSGTLLKPTAKQLEMLIMKKQHGNSELITARRDMVDAHDQLVQIHRLRESGLLPDEIFNERKKEICYNKTKPRNVIAGIDDKKAELRNSHDLYR